MKKRIAALLLAALMIFSLCSCGSNEKYRSVGKAAATEHCVIAFRNGDKLLEYVDAALQVLSAAGYIQELSEKWFGSDLTTVNGDIDALMAFEALPQRSFIMGFDPNAVPMSFRDADGSYTGFDIELAGKICELLDWELKLQPIDPADMELELKSGNVDCVWGGFSLTGSEDVSVSQVYMENEIVFVVRGDSGIHGQGGLSGKTLAISADPAANAALGANESRRDAFASIKPLAAIENCFNALDEGLCDVILVDSVAMVYYNNN